VKQRALRLLQRLGLLRVAFRTYERAQALAAPDEEGRADDGLPVPPADLRVRVAGTPDLGWFLEGGRLGEQTIRRALDRHGVAVENVDALLDFGCGCGRVTRRWRDLRGVHGSDMNADAIAWCRANLAFGRFETNGLEPPLAFADDSFDLVYALSVFTHLTLELQRAWVHELRRVLRPGGLLLVTTHGAAYRERLSNMERKRFDAGEVVVRWEDAAGTNLCSAYHSETALRALADGFTFLELEREGAIGNPHQDLTLLRKD
jgi:SAM-dependent methyltransferase